MVRCDVNRPADARKLLEQVLAKQRIALGDRKRFESEPIDSVKSRDGERSRVSSDEKKSVPLGSALGRDGGHFEVEVSLAQLQQALVELQGHPDVFASCSLESPLPPAALGRVVAGSEKALKGQASGEEPRIAKKPPTATQSLDQDASMSRALEESPLPLDAPQTTAGGLLGGQSQRPVRSHLTQQVTPTQQMPAGTSQAGVAGQMVPLSSPADRGKIADDSLREGGGRVAAKADKASPAYQPFRQKEQQPLATQALSDGAKQRVVFLFRLVPSAAAAEAVRVAGPEKTKAAAKGEAVQAAKGIQRAAEPAKPAAATSPLPAANNAADSPK